MTLSVVIPIKNEEAYIGDTLKHLYNQEELPEEVILVDSLSTDKTVEVINSIPVPEGVKLTVVEKHFDGIPNAQHHGFNLVKSDIIARTDADTHAPRDWTKRIRENFEAHHYDGLSGPFVAYDIPWKTTLLSKYNIYTTRFFLGHYGLLGFNLSITKRMWDIVKNEVCLDRRQVHEDLDLSIHIGKHGGVIGYDPKLIVATSARRAFSNPKSFFIEYQIRTWKTLHVPKHKEL